MVLSVSMNDIQPLNNHPQSSNETDADPSAMDDEPGEIQMDNDHTQSSIENDTSSSAMGDIQMANHSALFNASPTTDTQQGQQQPENAIDSSSPMMDTNTAFPGHVKKTEEKAISIKVKWTNMSLNSNHKQALQVVQFQNAGTQWRIAAHHLAE